MIQVIDYGGGNIGSLVRCLERLEIPYQKVDSGDKLTTDKPMILPGVGAFGALMDSLNQRHFTTAIQNLIKVGVPYLGICVGMQILLDECEEAPGVAGLGIIPGKVVRFRGKKVPQIGWNAIESNDPERFPPGYTYFVHSYYAQPDDPAVTCYQARYYGDYCAGVSTGNITAFQFHPEKSGTFGHELMKQWVARHA